MSNDSVKIDITSQSIEEAFGPEVSLFLHCHLRGYDRHGEGKYKDNSYYDKYGAPPSKENSWEEGYHIVEKKLAEHYNAVVDNKLNFPLIAGMGGGVHLYKSRHGQEGEEPWNWTGWIPQQTRWLSQGCFFSNRYFLGLRGNEIQNNLWDYDPHDEEENEDTYDLMYSQLEPNDRYRGGYWFCGQSFGRYLHIIALKSYEKDPETNVCKRYNYIVHPLAYRASIDTIPDSSVDAMQWCIINMPQERHFGEGKPWGEKCHGLEIFNDFTYFYSYQALEKKGPYNSHLCEDPARTIDGDNKYYFWYDTYPMEFAVFLLDSALARGVYFHTMCANDAFFERTTDENEEPNEVLLADPKGGLLRYNMKKRDVSQDPRLGVLRTAQPEHTSKEEEHANNLDAIGFLKDRPYGIHTAFGYVTLLDPRYTIKNAVHKEKEGIAHMGLNEGEKLAMEYLRKGCYYSTTGLHSLFKYEYTLLIPYKIKKQPIQNKLCYDITEDMELKFTFLKCTEEMSHLIWRYTIMFENSRKELETSHGYFKLDPEHRITLDLHQSYTLAKVKWLYFTAISPRNPQHRAWFHAIRGPAFGEPQFHSRLPDLKHNVVLTTRTGNNVFAAKNIEPTLVPSGELDFALGTNCNEKDIFVYFMQVHSLQQDFSKSNDMIKESSELIPPRILQSVHGYFNCRDDHPTRLNLTASWDKKTVKDGKVYFYRIDSNTGKPSPMATGSEPKLFGAGICKLRTMEKEFEQQICNEEGRKKR